MRSPRQTIYLIAFATLAMAFAACTEKVKFTADTTCGAFGNPDCPVTPRAVESQEDTFIVAAGQADILFVVDNSGSMSPEHKKIAERFATFANNLHEIDYHIALTTTDISYSRSNRPGPANGNGALQDGRLIDFGNGTRVLTPETENGLDLFRTAVQRPETLACDSSGFTNCPSSDERGIFAAYLAVSRREAGFFRPGAHFALVILADEDERSRGGEISGYELDVEDQPENLVAAVSNAFGADKTFSVHSIVIKPGDDACLTQQNQQSGVRGFVGKTYAALTELTGGVLGSICSNDYAAELGTIASNIVEQANSFALHCTPVNNEVSVTLTPEVPGANPTYVPEENKVHFNTSLPWNTQVKVFYNCEV